MVSFDSMSLFTNVPLEENFNITLERIYDRKEINIQITLSEMKELLAFCTKNVRKSGLSTKRWSGNGVSIKTSSCWYLHG